MTTAPAMDAGDSGGNGAVVPAREDVVRAHALGALDEACAVLARVDSVDEAKLIRDKAMAIQTWAREARDTTMFEKATRLRLTAERRAGEVLDAMAMCDGGHAQRTRFQKGTESPPTLAKLGITRKQSMRWQRLAKLPAAEFEAQVGETLKRVIDAVGAAQGAAIRRAERMAIISALSRANAPLGSLAGRYPVIYADPPWRYAYSRSESRAIENQYPTMSLDELVALPVPSIAYEQCVLFLWATPPKLGDALALITAWGLSIAPARSGTRRRSAWGTGSGSRLNCCSFRRGAIRPHRCRKTVRRRFSRKRAARTV